MLRVGVGEDEQLAARRARAGRARPLLAEPVRPAAAGASITRSRESLAAMVRAIVAVSSVEWSSTTITSIDG